MKILHQISNNKQSDLFAKLKQRRKEIRREYQNKPTLNYHAFKDEEPRDKILQTAMEMIDDVKHKSNDLLFKMQALEDKWKFSEHMKQEED